MIAASTLLALVVALTPVSDAASILEAKEYVFCHDPTYPLSEDEALWCPHVGEEMPRCPALPAACAAPRAEMVESRSGRFVGSGGSSSAGGESTGPRRRRPQPPRKSRGSGIGGGGGDGGGERAIGASAGSGADERSTGERGDGESEGGGISGASASAGAGAGAGAGTTGGMSSGTGLSGHGSEGMASETGSTEGAGSGSASATGTATGTATGGISEGASESHGASAGESASDTEGASESAGASASESAGASDTEGASASESHGESDSHGEDTDAASDTTTGADEPEDEDSIPALSGLAQLLFWAIIILGILIVLVAILRNTRRDRDDADPSDDPTPTPADGDAATTPLLAGPRGPESLLDRAIAAARAQRYAEAVALTHAALLCDLDARALIRLDPALTHGDYLRALRSRPELHREVKQVLREIEPVFFGDAPATQAIAESTLARVKALIQRPAAAILALAFAGLIGLACQRYSEYHPFETSPSGSQAVVELARRNDIHLTVRHQPYLALATESYITTLVITEAAPIPTAEEWTEILAWTGRNHHLILAGAELPPGSPFAWIAGVDVQPPELITPESVALSFRGDAGDLEVLRARGDAIYAARVPHEDGMITVVADGRLFTNMSLAFADDPTFAIALLGHHGSRAQLVDGLMELGADAPSEVLANLKATPLILHLLLLIGVFYLARGVAFGLPRDPPERSRRRFADHVDALGQVYARARATRHAARVYAAWALDRLRERTLVDRKAGILPLAQAIAARTGESEAATLEVVIEAVAMRSEDSDSPTADDIPLMRRLARLLDAFGVQR